MSQSSRPRSTPVLAASLTGLALAVAGCGGDDEKPKAAKPSFMKVPAGVEGKTVRAVDGDTLIIEINGKKERVRLLGIDAPEVSKKKGKTECGGEMARGAMRQLVKRSPTVTVSADPTQAERDEFGRMLAYITSVDTNKAANTWQGALLSSGWAEVYEQQGKPVMLDAEFKRQVADAKTAEAGVWGLCGGDFHQAE